MATIDLTTDTDDDDLKKTDDERTSTSVVTQASKNEKNSNDDEKKEAAPKPRGLKSGEYTSFTGVFGVYQQFGGYGEGGRCVSRHNSIDDANRAAADLFEQYCKDRELEVGCEEILAHNPYQAFATIHGQSNTLHVKAQELEIEECQVAELKQILKRDHIELTKKTQSKKKLLAAIKPHIQHKKHLNRYKEIDFGSCELCRDRHPDQYQEYQAEKARDPAVVRGKLISNMYRKTLFDAIKESEVKAQYGLTDDDLEKAVAAQELHFQKRSCFGNYYRRYERGDIIRYYKKMQKLKKETETELEEKTESKRKSETPDDGERASEVAEPMTKKRKLNNVK
mmetsp:Transcript_54127/g.89608  ORF Transcript_54127/g.89608 Transcript_54127/m.89608 type:complete len:338 (+) Transcript_54127:40-1053(+)